ncbi:monocarboxylate transporter 7-like isoform X2 [Xiphophorus maculatus]|uniref:Monocarboxylate transporter 7 n=2 Tax=Xiphophorus maculatus TaxID=8083 RepID=M3ZY49_XIPMA|nr:monocarboxylate transporter 7-like isoform X2 [Xiphophorus maculatus]XP_023205380.1 monocarboxylate transporter 7-like isoform X2 [Xiphophorus maculatus]
METPRVPGCLGPNVYPAVPDGGWGWAVAVAFFMVEVNTYGVLKTLGVFLQDLMEEFQESNSRVSWVISISAFIFAFTAPLASLLSNRFGYRPVVMMGGFLMSLGMICSAFTSSINQMYVTIGIISGFGFCLSFLPTVTILAQYFSRRRALVTSIASSGESFAIFAFAPAFSRLKQAIGWRCCLVVLGVMQASVVVFGVLLRPISIEPEPVKEDSDSDSMSNSDSESASLKQQSAYELENEQTRTSLSSAMSRGSGDSGVTSLSSSDQDLRDNAEEVSLPPSLVQEAPEGGAGAGSPPRLLDFSMLKDAAFLWYCLFGLLATLGFFAPQLYIIELSKSRGVAPSVAPSMLSVMAVAEIVGRFSIGVVMNRVGCKKTRVLLGCVVAMAMVLLAFAVVWEFWGLAVCCALYGFFMGTVGSTHIPLLAEDEVVGIGRMPACVGVYVFIQSFAGLAGPPLGGVLVDVTKNYGAAFYSCAAGMGLSAVCLALVGVAKSGVCHRTSGSENKEEEEQVSQDSKPLDFLEVDLMETSLVEQAEVV